MCGMPEVPFRCLLPRNIIITVSYTHLDVYKRQVLDGGDLDEIHGQLVVEGDSLMKAMNQYVKTFISDNYENARMAVGKDVKALRRQLQEGEGCPVCGSTAHPYHQEQEVVDTLFRSIEQEYNVASTNYQQRCV